MHYVGAPNRIAIDRHTTSPTPHTQQAYLFRCDRFLALLLDDKNHNSGINRS